MKQAMIHGRLTRAFVLASAGFTGLIGGVATGTAETALIRADVTAVQVIDNGTGFGAPTITFINLSDPGYQITQARITNGFFDFVNTASVTPPAGGSATAQGGTQLSNSSPNDGCNAVNFATTGFDASETFSFRADPENNACGNIVLDWRNRLNIDQPFAFASFAGPGITGATTLSGSDWVLELIN
jgi:hypothetical protein